MSRKEMFELLFHDLAPNEFIDVRLIGNGPPRQKFCQRLEEVDAICNEAIGRKLNAFWGIGVREGRNGKKDAVSGLTTIWADLDAKRFNGDKTAALKQLNGLAWPPSIVIDSGGGYHAYWLLKARAGRDALPKAEAAMKSLQVQLGTDAVHDASRILRIPETLNFKPEYGEPRSVEMVYCRPELRYDLSDFPSASNKSQSAQNPIAALIQPYWQKGQRNTLSLYLSGALARSRRSLDEASAIITEAAAGDEELPARLRTMEHTYNQFHQGEKVLGMAGLEGILTAQDAKSLAGLLDQRPQRDFASNLEDPNAPWYLSANALLNKPFPQERWLIESLWGDLEVGFIGGSPKVGKTWIGFEMAISIVTGQPMFGKFAVPKPGPVLYIAGEDHQRWLKERIKLLLAGKGLAPDALKDQLYIATIGNILEGDEAHEKLETAIRTLKVRAVFLDPLIRMHRADENSARELSEVLGYLRHLSRTYNCSIIVVHHLRKPKNGGQASHPGNELRGSVDNFGWLDSFIFVQAYKMTNSQLEKARVTLIHRNARPIDPFIVNATMNDTLLRFDVSDQPPAIDGLQEVCDRIVDFLASQPERWATKQQLRDGIKGKEETKIEALEALESDGTISKLTKRLPAKDGKNREQVIYSLVDEAEDAAS